MIYSVKTVFICLVVASYLWPFPNNTPGLAWVWSQLIVAQWFVLSWEAVVFKQTSSLQTLLAQRLIILLSELHCTLVGANALFPLLLMGQSMCRGSHPLLSAGYRGPLFLWTELGRLVLQQLDTIRTCLCPSLLYTVTATGEEKTGWDHRQGGASRGQQQHQTNMPWDGCDHSCSANRNTPRGNFKLYSRFLLCVCVCPCFWWVKSQNAIIRRSSKFTKVLTNNKRRRMMWMWCVTWRDYMFYMQRRVVKGKLKHMIWSKC